MMKTEQQIKIFFLDSNWTKISKMKCSEGRVIRLTLLAIRVCVCIEKRSHCRVLTG